MDLEPWFEPKARGYGAGRPVHPHGWRLIAVYAAALTGSGLLFTVALPFLFGVMEPKTFGYGWTMPPLWMALFVGMWLLFAVAPLTAWLTVVAKARTRGGWRWRSGKSD